MKITNKECLGELKNNFENLYKKRYGSVEDKLYKDCYRRYKFINAIEKLEFNNDYKILISDHQIINTGDEKNIYYKMVGVFSNDVQFAFTTTLSQDEFKFFTNILEQLSEKELLSSSDNCDIETSPIIK